MALFGDPILAGLTLIRRAIKSKNYVAGTSGWQITAAGAAEFNSVTVRGQLQAGGDGSTGHPGTTYNAPVPAAVSTYYLTKPAINGITKPETVSYCNLSSDGAGNQLYEALVVDSHATKVSSLVTGTIVGGAVNETTRIELNPAGVLGGGQTEFSLLSTTLILRTDPGTDPAQTVAGSRVTGDSAHRWSLAANGTQGWGPGGATLTDAYLARIGVNQMEMASWLQMHNFSGAVGDNCFSAFNNGEGNGRFFIHYDGQLRWSDGTASSDIGLFRRAVNELSTDGDFSLSAVGGGLLIKTGANCTLGTSVLVGGTVTVANTNVTANCVILVTCQTPGGAPGFLRVSARTAGVSFTILSSSATDTSTVGWVILYPA